VQAVNRHLRAAPGQDAAKPFFDSRVAARHGGTRVAASAGERSARTQLRARLGRQANLQVDPLTGTARSLTCATARSTRGSRRSTATCA
jgi:hypothetical protein